MDHSIAAVFTLFFYLQAFYIETKMLIFINNVSNINTISYKFTKILDLFLNKTHKKVSFLVVLYGILYNEYKLITYKIVQIAVNCTQYAHRKG